MSTATIPEQHSYQALGILNAFTRISLQFRLKKSNTWHQFGKNFIIVCNITNIFCFKSHWIINNESKSKHLCFSKSKTFILYEKIQKAFFIQVFQDIKNVAWWKKKEEKKSLHFLQKNALNVYSIRVHLCIKRKSNHQNL